MATPSVRSTSQANAGSTVASQAINKPTGAATGDVVVIFVNYTDLGTSGTVTATSSGFTVHDTALSTNASDYHYLAVMSKVIDGSEGSTFTVNFSTNSYCEMTAVCVQDTAGFDAISVFEVASYVQTRRLPSVTTTGANSLLVAFAANWYTATFDTSPSGWTAGPTWDLTASFWKTQASAGASGDTNYDGTPFELYVSAVVALKESVAADNIPPRLPRTNHRALLIR